ncbi:SRPBCC family protein [Micromonospora sp. 4G55]|nr:SRPBCC family protein [Micromonospora sp. 4G55]
MRQTPEQVWGFLADPPNSVLWDRSVAELIPHSPDPAGVGYEATTVAPSGMRQQLRITEYRPSSTLRFVLLESSMFKRAELSFLIDHTPEGTRIVHVIELHLHRRLFYPVLRLTSKPALARDLARLKAALAEAYPSKA